MFEDLLNLTTLSQLAQLEGRIPGFFAKQIGLIDEHWAKYMSSIRALSDDPDTNKVREIFHKMKGHTGMIGFKALSYRLGQLEMQSIDGIKISSHESLITELTDLKTRSITAARSFKNL